MKDNATPAGSVLERVTAFTLDLAPRDIPERTMLMARLLLLDTLGIAAAATVLDPARLARALAASQFAPGPGAPAARMLFDGRTVSLSGAVYAAATQIDNLDGHDGYNPTKGHIGVVAVPTLAALGEDAPGMSGPDALATLVVGYEVAGRAAIALHASVADYHTSGAWNALGVAAMAARVRGQSADVLRQSLGIAEYHGPRSQMMREIANPTMLHDGSGWGALAGMTAALLAEDGFDGAPAITVEADDVAPHWADLGSFWQVDHQYIKPYPVCRWAHAAIDAVDAMIRAHDLGPQDIARVRVATFDNAAALFPGMPRTTSEAQYSLAFAVGAMIVHRQIGVAQITDQGLSDREVAAVVQRTDVVADPRHSARFPEGRWADVTLTLRDGRTLSSGDVHARGGPERPYDTAGIVAKYHAFADPALGAARAAALADAVLRLDQPDSRFADVARLIYAAP